MPTVTVDSAVTADRTGLRGGAVGGQDARGSRRGGFAALTLEQIDDLDAKAACEFARAE